MPSHPYYASLTDRAQSLDNELSNLVNRLRLDEILELAEELDGPCDTAEIMKLRDKVRLFGIMVSKPQPGHSCTSCLCRAAPITNPNRRDAAERDNRARTGGLDPTQTRHKRSVSMLR